jgi:hypothetical protein
MARQLKNSVEPPIMQVVIVQNWLEELKRMAQAKYTQQDGTDFSTVRQFHLQ